MKNVAALLLSIVLLAGCTSSDKQGQLVSNAEELNAALAAAQPGTVITMANGEWNDIQIPDGGIRNRK